jgi:hypothetical protein
MNPILDDIFEQKSSYKDYVQSGAKLFGIVFLVVFFAIYIGDILFGKASLEVLLNLQEEKQQYKTKALKVKEQNAKLQKKYFELKQLEPN